MFGFSSPAHGQEAIDVEFGFQENDWSDPETLEFLTTPVSQPGSTWGNAEQSDTYVQTGSAADVIDAFIPGRQGVMSDDIVVLAFDSRYLSDSANHSYLAFGSDEDPADAVWFGHGGGRFHVGTGTEFNLSSSVPSGVAVEGSFDPEPIIDDSRVRVRLGFDVATQVIRNFQVDVNSDGDFDQEFIDLAQNESISIPDVAPLDWFLLTYAGRGGSRADNVSLNRQSANGDYNNDLDFDGEDADVLCTAVVEGTDLFFDFNGNGQVNVDDVSDFAFEHESLPGDLDFNGATEFADFLVFSNQFGKPATYSQGDITCNGRADFADFLILNSFFGSTVGGQRRQSQAVPEPNSGYLAITAIICCVAAFRRRK